MKIYLENCKEPLVFNDLKDEFPKDISYIQIEIFSFKIPYRFFPFYAHNTLGKELEYPTNYDDFYSSLEVILLENFICGTAGIDEEEGGYNHAQFLAEQKILDEIREII